MPAATSGFGGMNARQFLHQALNFGLIVASALLIWKTLSLVTYTESPIVVVLRFVCCFCGYCGTEFVVGAWNQASTREICCFYGEALTALHRLVILLCIIYEGGYPIFP